MLAYLFWHRPRPGVEPEEYEQAQRQFHQLLEVESACFQVEQLPFEDGPGYEDWYLIEDWMALGQLNATAVDPRHRPGHDQAAALAGEGWGGVYACVRGAPKIPIAIDWLYKPQGKSSAEFLGSLAENLTVWQRQMVLAPAPEFCLAMQRESGQPENRRALL